MLTPPLVGEVSPCRGALLSIFYIFADAGILIRLLVRCFGVRYQDKIFFIFLLTPES